MCGIVGLALKKNAGFYKKDEDIFYEMLFADTLRGNDSTGVIFIEKDGSFGIAKDMFSAPLCIDDFKNTQMAKDLFREGKAIIGHNRKATVGKVQKDTAHPFVVDNTFAMVHNGTLYGHKLLHDTTVDSEALAIHLKSVLGADYNKEKFEEAMGKVNGAYAVACFNQETNKLHLLRNSQRPLCLVETDNAWYWASEYGMLMWILGRNNEDLKTAKVETVKEECLYTIDLTDSKLTKEEYVPKKAQPVATSVATGVGKIGWGKTHTKSDDDDLSKNEFKRLRKQLVFTTVSFWADDYVERNFPRTIADGETEITLMGELSDPKHKFKHLVQGFLDISKHPTIKEGSMLNKLYSGRIYDMTYDAATKHIVIRLDRLTIVPSSRTVISLPPPDKKDMVVDGKWIQERLDQNETPTSLH